MKTVIKVKELEIDNGLRHVGAKLWVGSLRCLYPVEKNINPRENGLQIESLI